MQFKLWIESELLTSDQVIGMIQQSPQFAAIVDTLSSDYWERYAERWGVTGTFTSVRLPVKWLVDMVNKSYIRISKNRSQEDVQNKVKSGARNPVIIGRTNAILDGSHSLEAAYYAGDEEINAIVPSNSEFTNF